MNSISIPGSVVNIGALAFGGELKTGCNFERIEIPSGVTAIEESTFQNCKRLKTITIPDSVLQIERNAFYGCASLQNITIPNGVTDIGDYSFCYCTGLQTIRVEAGNAYYSSDEYGALFDYNKETIIQYPLGNGREKYSIPDTVKTIRNHAFSGNSFLRCLHIPESVTAIEGSIVENTSTYVCSNTTECEAKRYADLLKVEFRLCGRKITNTQQSADELSAECEVGCFDENVNLNVEQVDNVDSIAEFGVTVKGIVQVQQLLVVFLVQGSLLVYLVVDLLLLHN